MNTKLLMSTSAVALGMAGLGLSFFPQEVAAGLGMENAASIVLQMLGALYFGFAMLNWFAKANLIGGIYSRPVAIGNLAHFMVGALALVKLVFSDVRPDYIWVAALVYGMFGLLFGYVFVTTPAFKSVVR